MEQWTQKEAIDYECARECITALIGVYVGQRHDEEARAAPDREIISRLDDSISQLWEERRNLQVTDAAELARVIGTYGPMVRTAMEAERRKLTLPAQGS